MSLQAIEAAISTPAPSLAAKLVMMALAYHHNSQTGRCFPSYERLATETGLNKSSVIRAVKELCGAQLLRKHQGARGNVRGQGSNAYALVFMAQRVMDLNLKRASGVAQPDKEIPPPKAKASGEGERSKRVVSHRKKPVRRISEDWHPAPKERDFGVSLGFPEDEVKSIALVFRDYWIGQGSAKASWPATFRNWLRREMKWRSEHGGAPRTSAERRGKDRVDGIRRTHEAALRAMRPRE